MKKWFKRAAFVLASSVLLIGGLVFTGLELAATKMLRKVQVTVQPLALRNDDAALDRGRYLFASRGCADCHGADGGGRMWLDDGNGLRVRGPNITSGPGSAVAHYQPVDWVRSIRHGVAPSGRPLLVMSSEDYNRLTDDDLASLVAYVRALPPLAGEPALVELPLPVRVLYGFGAIKDAAAKIDHTLPPQQPVAEDGSVAHGAYVANMCLGCHGTQLAGGRIPGGPPHWPAASNLTPGEGTVMDRYADPQALLALFRTGKRPDGTAVSVMPFEALGKMNETDVRALFVFLKSLKPLPQG